MEKVNYNFNIGNLRKAAFAIAFGLIVGKRVGEYVTYVADGFIVGLLKPVHEKIKKDS